MSGSDMEKSNAVEASTTIGIDDSSTKNSASTLFGCGLLIPPDESRSFSFVGPSTSTSRSNIFPDNNNKSSQSTFSFSQPFSPNPMPNTFNFGPTFPKPPSPFGPNLDPKPNNSFTFMTPKPPSPFGPNLDPKPNNSFTSVTSKLSSPFGPNLDPKPNNSFNFGPTFVTPKSPSPFFPNPDLKPNNFSMGPTFPKQPSLFSVGPTPSFGCGCRPSLWSNNTTAKPYAPAAFQFSPYSLKCLSNIPSPPIQKFGPPQFSAEASTPMCHVCKSCGHKSLWGQIWGSQGKPYAPTPESEGYWGQHIQSISAMPFYQNKSHEELRWEDYQSQGNYYNKGLSPFSNNPFVVGQTRASQFPLINGPALVIPLQGISYFNHFM